MIVKLKYPARVALAEGVHDIPVSEARRLLALGIAETVKVSPEEKPQETPKKRGRKKKD